MRSRMVPVRWHRPRGVKCPIAQRPPGDGVLVRCGSAKLKGGGRVTLPNPAYPKLQKRTKHHFSLHPLSAGILQGGCKGVLCPSSALSVMRLQLFKWEMLRRLHSP